ncbi:PREDICTED: dual specificity protein phosphatase 18 [Crocodylus porosus]|uniref:dual specificity protein phosphatase 18 n=1 Tax=Crocodylus porosus TaxID=8502 RepID=UPI0009402D0F|nr:PREDICTED: dual specificity protein phosphatase 18 [Crocodylus porosus]
MSAAFGAIPVLLRHPAGYGLSRITASLYLGNGTAANNKLLLFTNQISTVINVSVEVANTFHPHIQYLHAPITDNPAFRICDYFDPVADRIHAVDMQQGRTLLHCAAGVSRSAALCLAYLMKYHSMSLVNAHAWVKSCRPVIRPNYGFWEQLIQYEYKLFGTNTVRMISSPLGMIPDLYADEVRITVAF